MSGKNNSGGNPHVKLKFDTPSSSIPRVDAAQDTTRRPCSSCGHAPLLSLLRAAPEKNIALTP